MDRRQRKTRETIFKAFTELLSKKEFEQITVGEIIEQADIGRSTFYAHFETKEFLLKELTNELFCHIFDAMNGEQTKHKHIFECDAPDSVYLHLFKHLQKNDHHILKLLSGQNNDLFYRYFKVNFERLLDSQADLFQARKNEKLPKSFWQDHIISTFIATVKWWVANGMKEDAETITEYFFLSV